MSIYNNSIPQSTDFLSQSQQDILNNFSQLDTSMAVNHFAFSNTTANNGKHTYVEMVNSAIPALSDEQGTLYTKKVDAESQIFFSPDDTGREYLMTKFIESEFATFATNTNYTGSLFGGWSFLPGGLLLQYGRTNSSTASTINVTFPVEFPNSVFFINVSPLDSLVRDASVQTGYTTTAFSISKTLLQNYSAFWVAIGN